MRPIESLFRFRNTWNVFQAFCSALGSRILGIIQNNDVTASSPRGLFQNNKQNKWLQPATIKRYSENDTQKRSGRDASLHFIVRRNERILRALFQKRNNRFIDVRTEWLFWNNPEYILIPDSGIGSIERNLNFDERIPRDLGTS